MISTQSNIAQQIVRSSELSNNIILNKTKDEQTLRRKGNPKESILGTPIPARETIREELPLESCHQLHGMWTVRLLLRTKTARIAQVRTLSNWRRLCDATRLEIVLGLYHL